MTDSNKTAIALVVDRSGSMITIREDAQGAIDAYIEDQKNQPGECTLRLCDFDNKYRTVYASTPIKDVPPYRLEPRGVTALTDAIGKSVTDLGRDLAALPENERPGTVIVVIVTDGGENASREWTADRVKELITQQEEKYNWTFIFLAAGQDAIQTGATYGLGANSALTFNANNIGQTISLASSYTTQTRSFGGYHISDDDRDAAVQ